MSDRGNMVINGTDAAVWINGEMISETTAFEAKVTGQFEDVTYVGDYNTYKKFAGRSGEGTLTLNKVFSRGIQLMAEAFKTGVMPEIKIVSKTYNPQTLKAERTVIKNVTFTEFTLSKFENRSNSTEELPFSFSDYDIVEML